MAAPAALAIASMLGADPGKAIGAVASLGAALVVALLLALGLLSDERDANAAAAGGGLCSIGGCAPGGLPTRSQAALLLRAEDETGAALDPSRAADANWPYLIYGWLLLNPGLNLPAEDVWAWAELLAAEAASAYDLALAAGDPAAAGFFDAARGAAETVRAEISRLDVEAGDGGRLQSAEELAREWTGTALRVSAFMRADAESAAAFAEARSAASACSAHWVGNGARPRLARGASGQVIPVSGVLCARWTAAADPPSETPPWGSFGTRSWDSRWCVRGEWDDRAYAPPSAAEWEHCPYGRSRT